MFNMGKFTRGSEESPNVETNDEIPKDMDVFQRSEAQFLPEGKSFEDLTKEELKELRRRYRFDYYKPGVYQGITGYGFML